MHINFHGKKKTQYNKKNKKYTNREGHAIKIRLLIAPSHSFSPVPFAFNKSKAIILFYSKFKYLKYRYATLFFLHFNWRTLSALSLIYVFILNIFGCKWAGFMCYNLSYCFYCPHKLINVI